MKLYTCTDHAGHYPVGVASVIVAEDAEQARELLNAELISHHLEPDCQVPGEPKWGLYTLKAYDLSKPQAIVLNDGEY